MQYIKLRTYLILPALAAMLLAGCETMSKEECLSADWYQVGYKAGKEGRERSHIEYVAESCAKAGVTPDRELYFAGREEGVGEYCSPRHAFSLGINGSYYNAVCPPETARSFESYYDEGRRIFDARQHVQNLEAERHKLEHQLAEARTDGDKRQFRDRLESMDERLHSARDKLRFIESESRLYDAAP
jgi:hypothetical protein